MRWPSQGGRRVVFYAPDPARFLSPGDGVAPCDGIREFATASGHAAWPFSALAMPIYEYQCPACQKVFEEWTTVSEAHEDKPCPACGAASPRVLSNTSFVLKGAGWYVSDYGYRKGVKDEDSSTAYGASGAMTPPADTAPAASSGTTASSAPAPAGNSASKANSSGATATSSAASTAAKA